MASGAPKIDLSGAIMQGAFESILGFALGTSVDMAVGLIDDPSATDDPVHDVIDGVLAIAQIALTSAVYVITVDNFGARPGASVNTLPLWATLIMAQPGLAMRMGNVSRAVRSMFDMSDAEAKVEEVDDDAGYY